MKRTVDIEEKRRSEGNTRNERKKNKGKRRYIGKEKMKRK